MKERQWHFIIFPGITLWWDSARVRRTSKDPTNSWKRTWKVSLLTPPTKTSPFDLWIQGVQMEWTEATTPTTGPGEWLTTTTPFNSNSSNSNNNNNNNNKVNVPWKWIRSTLFRTPWTNSTSNNDRYNWRSCSSRRCNDNFWSTHFSEYNCD